ncbi:hypothetical protein SELMODRAFT_428846 [Selaginella moellendorffii]|uniref:Uncharacterized protein n=1 Tax=Selaginella moellendorffii TaxID=88036 RepID=D8T471_SELML|nr:hypothetical protein SELMODRAFT_428846 [Selaginella moellendorffii]
MRSLNRGSNNNVDLKKGYSSDHRGHLWEHEAILSDAEIGPVAKMFRKLLTNVRADIECHPNCWQIRQCVWEPNDSYNDLGKVYQHAARLWCDNYVEFKNDKSKLAEGCGQVLDRAEKHQKGAWAKKKVVLGSVSTGTDILPMVVFTDVVVGSHVVKGVRWSLESEGVTKLDVDDPRYTFIGDFKVLKIIKKKKCICGESIQEIAEPDKDKHDSCCYCSSCC